MKNLFNNLRTIRGIRGYDNEKLNLSKSAATSRTRHCMIKMKVPQDVADKFEGFLLDECYWHTNDFKMTESEAKVRVILFTEDGENEKIETTATITWVVHFGGLMAIVDHRKTSTKWGRAIDVIQFPHYMLKRVAETEF